MVSNYRILYFVQVSENVLGIDDAILEEVIEDLIGTDIGETVKEVARQISTRRMSSTSSNQVIS
jgi:hypothetical protein